MFLTDLLRELHRRDPWAPTILAFGAMTALFVLGHLMHLCLRKVAQEVKAMSEGLRFRVNRVGTEGEEGGPYGSTFHADSAHQLFLSLRAGLRRQLLERPESAGSTWWLEVSPHHGRTGARVTRLGTVPIGIGDEALEDFCESCFRAAVSLADSEPEMEEHKRRAENPEGG